MVMTTCTQVGFVVAVLGLRVAARLARKSLGCSCYEIPNAFMYTFIVQIHSK